MIVIVVYGVTLMMILMLGVAVFVLVLLGGKYSHRLGDTVTEV